MLLSIIIVNRNTRKFLVECLKSIYNNSLREDFEVFVVDNNSSDGSCTMVKEKFPQVNLIENRENLGFAKANNQAMREARARYILLLNPDTLVLPFALEKMVGFMNRHPKVGILGPKLLNPDGSLQPSCRSFPTLTSLFFEETLLSKIFSKNRWIGSYRMSFFSHNCLRGVDQVSGACLMLRKELLDEIGLLDERFFLYFEEVDLCFRARKSNWNIYFLPEVSFIHNAGQASRAESLLNLKRRYQSLYQFYRKHFPFLYLVLLKIFTSLGIFLRMTFFSFLALFNKKNHEIKIKARDYRRLFIKNLWL